MPTDDFFHARLDQMIDLHHPLAVLANRLPWPQIEAALAPAFERKNRQGQVVEINNLFDTTLVIAGGGVSAAGRPRLPIRLLASLLYLKHAFNLSDEELVTRWSENVVWQYFSGQAYYTPKLLCDATLRSMLCAAGYNLADEGSTPLGAKGCFVALCVASVDQPLPRKTTIYRRSLLAVVVKLVVA